MLETAFTLPFWFEFAATVTGGLSGGMSAARARYDIFGCVAIACITGMGGGIIRDVLLQEYGLYAFQSPWFLLSCAVAGVIVFYFGKLATYLDPIVDLLDNISVALWAIIGASKSLSAGLGIIPSVVLGTITAIGGGISRDVLMNRAPVAFQTGPIYGSAALIGCIVYCPLKANGILPDSAGFLCAMLIMALRYLSLILGWRTKPPRDYSDRVVESVVRPARFIARKVHVPVGKTARDRDNSPGAQMRRAWGRFYNRISGHWMDAAEGGVEGGGQMTDQMPPLVKVQPTENIAAVTGGVVRWRKGRKGQPVSSLMADEGGRVANAQEDGEGATPASAPAPAAATDGATAMDPVPPGSDRIFVNRTELHRLMYELGASGEVDRSGAVERSGASAFRWRPARAGPFRAPNPRGGGPYRRVRPARIGRPSVAPRLVCLRPAALQLRCPGSCNFASPLPAALHPPRLPACCPWPSVRHPVVPACPAVSPLAYPPAFSADASSITAFCQGFLKGARPLSLG